MDDGERSPARDTDLSGAAQMADTASTVALAGHPLHAMMIHFPIAFGLAALACDGMLWWGGDPFWLRAGLWATGGAFLTGVAAGVVGLAELLLVPGIRLRLSGWAHAVAATVLIAVLGANWLLRLVRPEDAVGSGLALSALGAVMTGVAGWHGGKLIYHHGLAVLPQEDSETEA